MTDQENYDIRQRLQRTDARHDQGIAELELARKALKRDKKDFLHLPWPSLHSIVRGIAPKKLWYVVMASNNGKTTFVRSLVELLIASRQKVYLMSTETDPEYFRLALAALEIGVDPGVLETGDYLEWPDAKIIQEKLDAILADGNRRDLSRMELLAFPEQGGFLTVDDIWNAAGHADEQGAKWFIVDHIDHVDPTGVGGEIAQSNAVNAALHEIRLRYNFRVIATSQMNQEPFRRLGKLALISAPMEDWVKYGGTKKQHANGMLGGYRPMRSPKPEQKEIDAFKSGDLPLSDITIPGAMRFVVMKHRDIGKQVGQKATLDVVNGRIVEPSFAESGYLLHGIRTSRSF